MMIVENWTMISADLGKRLEAIVTKLVKSGRYGSKSEVLREGVRLVQEREARLAALDAALERGMSDADAGRVASAEEAFGAIEAKYLKAAKAR
jgi:antitoxin ParD1/3/4